MGSLLASWFICPVRFVSSDMEFKLLAKLKLVVLHFMWVN